MFISSIADFNPYLLIYYVDNTNITKIICGISSSELKSLHFTLRCTLSFIYLQVSSHATLLVHVMVYISIWLYSIQDSFSRIVSIIISSSPKRTLYE